MKSAKSRLIGLLIVLGFVGALLFSQRSTKSSTPIDYETLPQTLDIASPKVVRAGTPFQVSVSMKQSTGEKQSTTDAGSIALDILEATGVTRLTEQSKNGQAFFQVSSENTQSSGILRLLATTATSRGEVIVQIQPGEAADGIVPLAGPKTMIADGNHSTLVSVIPTDTYGNPLPENTSVKLFVRRPNDLVEEIDATVGTFVAGVRVKSGTIAGRTTMRVAVGDATGPEIEVEETPGSVVLFSLTGPKAAIRADGRSLIELSTPQLADRFGNVLLDGTTVTLQGDGPGGRIAAITSTVEGRAFFRLVAPSAPGRLSLVAFVGDVPSAPIGFEVQAGADKLVVAASRIGGEVEIRIGPVLTELGGFVPDGTNVSVTRGNGERSIAQIRSGVAVLKLPLLASEPFTVSVLDLRRAMVAP